MTTVEFPPPERVKVIGDFNLAEVIGTGVAAGVFALGIATGQLWPWGLVTVVVVLAWTFAPNRRHPLRVIVPRTLRWLLRRNRRWAAPIRGRSPGAPFLRGTEVVLAPAEDAAVGVVVRRQAYTVMFDADRPSMTFATEGEQAEMLSAWGEVLGGLCVERGAELTAERVGWSEVHRAADPSGLQQFHAARGVDGPASDDYASYVAGFDTVGSARRVIVWATITRPGRFRVARRAGFAGRPGEVMSAAAVAVGNVLRSELASRGFSVGALLTPVEISRLITGVCDPYRAESPLSNRERFGLADRFGPDHVDGDRHLVSMGHALHRVFAISYPRVAVDGGWMWKPMAIAGPKLTTTVFEPVAPSRADRQREASTTRGVANNEILAATRRGHVRERDRRKVGALRRAEVAVAAGHQELDAYTLIVVTARSRAELDRRCNLLRQRLREAGRAGVRELTGLHDEGVAAALPIGVRVANDGE